MRCPECGSHNQKVMDSRPADRDTHRWRRHKCMSCGTLYNTCEVYEWEYKGLPKSCFTGTRIERRKKCEACRDCMSCEYSRATFN